MNEIKLYDNKIYIPSTGKYCDFKLSCNQLSQIITTLKCNYKEQIDKIQASTNEIKIINEINNNSESILDYYMPILNNNSGIIEKYEVLVRLKLKEKIIAPLQFLPLIKSTPLETKVSKIILNKAIKTLKENPGIQLSINITSNDLMNNNYINYMKNKLIDNNIGKNRLNVELLESISNINNNLDLEQIVEIFNSFGVNVFIDDLGTGNSNINRLLNVKNIHSVKIDGGIIQGLSENNLEGESNENKLKRIEKAKEIITLIVQIAENQDPKQKVIAEYVSNKYIFETVKKLGVHYSQGYYIGKASKNLFLKNK